MTHASALSGAYDIVGIDGAAPPAQLSPVIEFADDGSVFGQVVNRFRGTAAVAGDTLTCGPIMSTLMAGPGEAMDAEARVFALLGGPLTISHDDDVVLSGADGALRLRRQPNEADTATAAVFSVSGTVSYRQRIALPPDALTTVTLQDVARQDVAATTLATTESTGGQVPIPYVLEVDRASIPSHATLAVRATIQARGELLWTTDTAHLVDHSAGDVSDVVIPVVQTGTAPEA